MEQHIITVVNFYYYKVTADLIWIPNNKRIFSFPLPSLFFRRSNLYLIFVHSLHTEFEGTKVHTYCMRHIYVQHYTTNDV